MAQSHLPVRHLIRQLEQEGHEPGLTVPPWLAGFIDAASQLFEPFRGVARAGYECYHVGNEWEVSLYLGSSETIGGALDGQLSPVNFRFDLKGLLNLFDSVSSYVWNALPDTGELFDEEPMVSFIAIEGLKSGQTVRLQLHATAPGESGPGLRQYGDGRVELV